jgi:predicted N-acetyltransferase YhbS
LRWARPDDLDALAEFNRWVFAEPSGEPDEQAALQLREYMSSDHPTASPGDHVLVEDQATGKIVSSICSIPQTWSYGGIPFGVSRPELVGTDPDYRNRGLVRAQMEALHALSEERGDLLQAITGIPYFYRQFGYEKALITSDGRYGLANVLKDADRPSTYQVRAATDEDLPHIVRGHQIAAARRLVAAVRDECAWRWELTHRLTGSDYTHSFWVIERADGTAAGVLANQTQLDWRRPILWATFCELFEGESWPEAVPIIIEHLRQEANKMREGDESIAVGFDWGADHPLVELESMTMQGTVRPFRWLIRIPNLVMFLKHISPVLNERLSNSVFHRYDGELALTFYQSGLKLTFANGQLAEIADFLPPSFREAGASFPELTFYYLLLGSRTFEELEYVFPDCFVRKQSDLALLNVLFPKIPSSIWPL